VELPSFATGNFELDYQYDIETLALPVLTNGSVIVRRNNNLLELSLPKLTAADTLDDRLRGFRAGADDYLVKPFALAELLARLQALVRRSSRFTNNLGKTLRIADLKLCASTREVIRDHQPLMLTKMGFTILEKLMQHAPAIVPRADLEFHLWGDEPPGSDALRTHIATLRAAIDPPDLPPLLLTHRGVGYQLLSSRRSAP
jgi:DNA-binding response OmpR family regulator